MNSEERVPTKFFSSNPDKFVTISKNSAIKTPEFCCPETDGESIMLVFSANSKSLLVLYS